MESFIAMFLISFLVSYLSVKYLKGYFLKAGLKAVDLHKENKPVLPTSMGIATFIGFYIGVIFYTMLRIYYFHQDVELLWVLAALLSILLATLVGLVDDIYTLKGGRRIGLKQWQKPFLTLFAALPLIAVGMGQYNTIFGLKPGILYPILILPIIFVGTSNMVNILAGLNGLEGLYSLTFLSFLFYFSLKYNASLAGKIIIVAGIGAILGFLLHNLYPAKVLPGDSFTYFAGALIGVAVVLTNTEEPALLLALPYFLELVLKARGRFKQPTVGDIKNGKIVRKTKRIFSIPHLFMNGKFTEPEVVFLTWLFIFSAGVLAILLF